MKDLELAHEAIIKLCGEMHRDASTVPSGARDKPCPVCRETHIAVDRAVEAAYARGKAQQAIEYRATCETCKKAIDYLNLTAGRNYRGSDRIFAMLHARIEGYGLAAVLDTVGHRWRVVSGTKWEWTMRPETIFNATKFDGYHAEMQTAGKPERQDGWLKK